MGDVPLRQQCARDMHAAAHARARAFALPQVSHERGKTMKMVVPARGIWGTAGIDGLNIDRAIESE